MKNIQYLYIKNSRYMFDLIQIRRLLFNEKSANVAFQILKPYFKDEIYIGHLCILILLSNLSEYLCLNKDTQMCFDFKGIASVYIHTRNFGNGYRTQIDIKNNGKNKIRIFPTYYWIDKADFVEEITRTYLEKYNRQCLQ